jgi:rod shape-determining protein MreD
LPIFAFFPVAIIQFLFVPMVAIGTIIPDLVTILLVYYALRYGQIYGTVLGSIFGLLFDIISGGILGSAMFSKTISGFVAGYFYNENKIEFNTQTMFFIVIVFVSSTINSFFYLLLTSSEIKLTAAYLILEQGILPGIYTAVVSIPVVIFNQNRKIT